MIEWLKDWIKNDMQTVLEAKRAFAMTLVFALLIAYGAASWRYGGIIGNLESSIKAQEARHRAELSMKNPPSSSVTAAKPEIVTISSGEITLSGPGLYLVDTENMSAEDDLSRIIGLSEGDKVALRSVSSARTIAVRESPHLKMAGQVFFLNHKHDKIEFTCGKDSVCIEDNRISIGSGGYGRLERLSPQEKEMLRYYVEKKTYTQSLPQESGIVAGLVRDDVLYLSAKDSMHPYNDNYNIELWAFDYITERPELIE